MKNVILITASSVLVATFFSGCIWGEMNNKDKEKLKHVSTKPLEKDCDLATIDDVKNNLKLNGRDSDWNYFGFVKNGQILLKDGFLVNKQDNQYDYYEYQKNEAKAVDNLIKVTKTESIVNDRYVVKACAKKYSDKELEKIVFVDSTGAKNAEKSINKKTYKSDNAKKILEKIELLNEKHNQMLAINEIAKSQHILLPITFSMSPDVKQVFPVQQEDSSLILQSLNKSEAKIDEYILKVKERIKNNK